MGEQQVSVPMGNRGYAVSPAGNTQDVGAMPNSTLLCCLRRPRRAQHSVCAVSACVHMCVYLHVYNTYRECVP